MAPPLPPRNDIPVSQSIKNVRPTPGPIITHFFFSKIFNLPTHPATPLATKPSPLLLCTENKPHKFSSSISNSVLTAEYFVKISNDNLDITTAKQIILPDRPATLRYTHTKKNNHFGGWFGNWQCTPSPFPSSRHAPSTRNPGGDRRLDRSIWSPPPCWQTSCLSAPAWPSGSQKLMWTPQRSEIF